MPTLDSAWVNQAVKLPRMPQISSFLMTTSAQFTELLNGEETFLTTSESSSNFKWELTLSA